MKKVVLVFAICSLFSGPVLAGKSTDAPVKSPGFSKLDKNKDGYLSAQEAKNWEPLPKVFPHVDANQDGKLDKAEFSALEENISK